MDWTHILYNCLIWLIFVVLLGAGLYLLVAIPATLIAAVLGIFWSAVRFFVPILPSFGKMLAEEPSKPRKSNFDWLDKTEAQKLTELNEHIRIQHMNQERNSR